MSPLRRQPLTVEHALLGLLRAEPMYGYEIHQHLQRVEGIGRVWSIQQSRVYSLLTRLERDGFIEAELEAQPPRPPRKVFHLTAKGRDAYMAWVRTPVRHGRKLRLDFLAKLYFAHREGEEVIGALLADQRRVCQSWLAEQRALAAELDEERPYDWLVHHFRIGQIEAMLNWLDQCERTLAVRPAAR